MGVVNLSESDYQETITQAILVLGILKPLLKKEPVC
jgi:hypothetical protein